MGVTEQKRPSTSWREGGPKRERGLCDFTEWGCWSGELYVCDEPATKRHKREAHKTYDPRKMRRATPDENRRVFSTMQRKGS
jgi:hypothetical protein